MSTNTPATTEQTIRLNMVLNLKELTVEQLDERFTWVMGSKSSIIPVAKFEVIK